MRPEAAAGSLGKSLAVNERLQETPDECGSIGSQSRRSQHSLPQVEHFLCLAVSVVVLHGLGLLRTRSDKEPTAVSQQDVYTEM